MAEMINRAALIDKLCKKAHEWRGTMTGDIYANVTQMVKRMPYVEVEPHEANESETKKCTCYRTREATRYLYQPFTGTPLPYEEIIGYCAGTREQDECKCGGDESKCDFYKEKRNDCS